MSSTTATSRKLKRLWLSVVLAAAVLFCAGLIQLLVFRPFVLFVRINIGAFVFGLLVPAFWVALSPRSDVTRSIALLVITIIALVFGILCFWLNLWPFHT